MYLQRNMKDPCQRSSSGQCPRDREKSVLGCEARVTRWSSARIAPPAEYESADTPSQSYGSRLAWNTCKVRQTSLPFTITNSQARIRVEVAVAVVEAVVWLEVRTDRERPAPWPVAVQTLLVVPLRTFRKCIVPCRTANCSIWQSYRFFRSCSPRGTKVPRGPATALV